MLPPGRTTPSVLSRKSNCWNQKVGIEYAHPVGLARSTAGDLLDAELVKLGLQLLELLGELLLVLAPELTSLDLGRLEKKVKQSVFTFRI